MLVRAETAQTGKRSHIWAQCQQSSVHWPDPPERGTIMGINKIDMETRGTWRKTIKQAFAVAWLDLHIERFSPTSKLLGFDQIQKKNIEQLGPAMSSMVQLQPTQF